MVSNIRIVDTIGWTTSLKVPFHGVLRGNLPHGWNKDWDEDNPDDRQRFGYIPTPTIDERVHACIMLVSAKELAAYENGGPLHETLAKNKAEAEKMGIAPILLVTKVDLVDQKLKENYQDLYESEELCEMINSLRPTGFTSSNIFLAQLYHIGTERRATIENTAMLPFAEALRRAVLMKSNLKPNPQPTNQRKKPNPQPTNQLKVCPNGPDCRIKDQRHLCMYRHKTRCPDGLRCNVIGDDKEHVNDYFHPCPEGKECKLISDPEHTKDYLHEGEPDNSSEYDDTTEPTEPTKQQVTLGEGKTQRTVEEVKTWNADQVLSWLGEVDITDSQVKEKFVKTPINGRMLLGMKDEQLKAMGIEEPLVILKISSEIQAILESNNL